MYVYVYMRTYCMRYYISDALLTQFNIGLHRNQLTHQTQKIINIMTKYNGK